MATPEWTTRPVDAPAADLLTKPEVARLLGVSQDTIDRLIEDGEFPEGMKIRKQATVWEWQDVAYYRLRLSRAARIRPPQPTAGGGQPTADEG
jgi:excisionase family DNA binding protein